MTFEELDDVNLLDTAEGPDHCFPVVEHLKPASPAEQRWSRNRSRLLVAWKTRASGVALIRFRGVVASRSGFLRLGAVETNWLLEAGVSENGVYSVGNSHLLRSSQESWIGAGLSTSEQWNCRHYVIVFEDDVIECVCLWLEFCLDESGRPVNEALRRLFEEDRA